MWSRPSTPPRSMKAPKSVMFLTTPFRTWPICELLHQVLALVGPLVLEDHAARLTTMFRRRLLSLMILNS